jgi:hypothetical protein
MTGNSFVLYLHRYTTVSPDHEAAFDEFITQVPLPSGEPLRLKTKTEHFVQTCFRRERPPSIILTGNAGDGKTYLCRQIIAAFTGQPVADWADRLEWPIERDGLTLRVVKDLSEMAEDAGADILWELALDQLEAQSRFVFLIAANEGRLRAVLQRERLEELYQEVDRQLREGPDLSNERLIVLNLNQVTTSMYVPSTLAWLTDPVHWEACQGCVASDACPIHFNATRLADAHIAGRLQQLYQVLENLDIHVTIRDMLIHLAYTLTGGLECETVIRASRRLAWESYRHVYYENVWGEAADEAFRHKAVVVQHLRRLDVGEVSVFEVDNFVVSGRPDDGDIQEEHERLFASALDLGRQRFAQERAAYLHGGASSPKPEHEHPLMTWLPHCRRKLFFEWQDVDAADRLFPFLYLPDYFRLVNGDRALLARYRRDLILGLNRTFSGLYLTDASHLYVTSRYAHAVEQPVPVVRVKISADGVDLRPHSAQSEAFDRGLATLLLEIFPPPRVRAEPVCWRVDLLRFEHLMRRARGSTPNVLAAECELIIRQLKDELLSRFASDEEEPGRIDFFAADRNRYSFRTLWMDEEGHIRV